MTGPVSGKPPPSRVPPSEPQAREPNVIQVPSNEMFRLVRNIISSAYDPGSYNVSVVRLVRPIISKPVDLSDQMDAEPSGSVASENQGRPRGTVSPMQQEGERRTGRDQPLEGLKAALESEAATPNPLPRDFKVPDLTDRSRHSKNDDRLAYQKMLMEMLERIARIVREQSLSRTDPASSDTPKRGAVAAGKAGALKTEKTHESTKEDPSVGLILKTTSANGVVEQLNVQTEDLPFLLENLEELAKQEGLLEEGNKSDSLEDVTAKTLEPTSKKEMSSKVEQNPKAAKGEKKTRGLEAQSMTGFVKPASGQALPLVSGGAFSSFMPYSGQGLKSQDSPLSEEAFKVEGVEASAGLKKFGADDAANKEPVQEAVAAAKNAKKPGRELDVENIVEGAKKDPGGKRGLPGQKNEEGKLVPVHGKFSVDQLGGVRRRSKSEKQQGGGKKVIQTQKMSDILYMVLCAVVCGAQTIFEIAAYVESREKWFTTLLGLREGLPSERLIARLLVSFNPSEISDMLNLWVREAQGAPLRSGLTTLSVAETFEGLIFGQERPCTSSSAEICMPRILQFFQMRGVVVLLSPGKTSKRIIPQILNRGAQYIYSCGEEPLPGEDVLLPLFEQAAADPKSVPEINLAESYVEGVEYLQLYEMPVEGSFDSIHSVCQVLSEIRKPTGKSETVQFFTSSTANPSVWLFELLRVQRDLEGKMEWMMNMSMRGKHGDEAAFAAREFLALVRRYAVNLLLREQTYKAPIHAKQKRAAEDTGYLLKLLRPSDFA